MSMGRSSNTYFSTVLTSVANVLNAEMLALVTFTFGRFGNLRILHLAEKVPYRTKGLEMLPAGLGYLVMLG